MKLPKGYGSVYKMKGKRANPWRALAPKTKKHLGYARTRKDALAILAEYHANPKNFRTEMTLRNIYELFLLTKKGKAEKTIKMYMDTWKYFADLAKEDIKEIKSFEVQSIIDDLEDEGYSYSTLQKVKMMAGQLFKKAMEDDYINKNYAEFVTIPPEPEPDKRVFSDEEIQKIKADAKENYWSKVMYVMIFTCMRPGELLNLTKFNVHLKDDYIIGGFKTEAGTDRYIPIFPEIKSTIQELMKLSKCEYLVSYDNKKVNHRFYLDRHDEIIEKLGLQKLTPHKCRKTGLTYFARRGMDRKALQRLAGHKDYKTTDKYYIGDISDEMNLAMKMMTK